jgi:hypothetical protein
VPRKLISVLCSVNHLRGGTQNLDVGSEQRQSDVVGGLAAHREDDTGGALELVDVQDGFETDVLEVQAVGFVVV